MAGKAKERAAQTLSLDQLIETSTKSAIQSFRDLKFDERRIKPRIWVGIRIEPFGPGDVEIPGTGPGR